MAVADVVQGVRVLEDGDSVCDWQDEEEPIVEEVPADAESACTASELYSEHHVAKLALRFNVGDAVRCSIGKGRAEGVVVKRFYREEDWPRGRYAAVRAPPLKRPPPSLEGSADANARSVLMLLAVPSAAARGRL